MAARRGVHAAVKVQTQQRVTVDPQFELGLGHGRIPVSRIRNKSNLDE